MSRCYGSGYTGSETKQALSRYKVLTEAITTARNRVSTQNAGGRLVNARAGAYNIRGLLEG
jgi:hypothetical protein